ncbi:MAG: hypothetical protein HOV80_02620 [Polyangiaceae bacterium]|nr:hypothetical protein [Polyangiaceae bacterium]
MSIRRFLFRLVLPLSFFSGFALVSQGCGSLEQDVCEQACDCEGCDEGDFNDCVDVLEDLKQDTSQEGCESDYQDLLSCLDSKMECDDDEVDLDDCEDELEEVADCLEDDVLGVAYESGGSDNDNDVPNDVPNEGGGGACDEIKDCCIAAAEQAMVSTASCVGYDSATEASCQAAIDAYVTPPGVDVLPECDFQ